MGGSTRQQAPGWGWPTDPTTRITIDIGLLGSLLLGVASFATWGLTGAGFADDNYLWWTLAGFLLPIGAAAGVAVIGRDRPEVAPAVGAAALMLAAAFLVALLG